MVSSTEKGRRLSSPPRLSPEEAALVPVRQAATVLLLRPTKEHNDHTGQTSSNGQAGRNGQLEVFVQHRVTTMDFAAGVVVFPGGRVDDVDRLGVESNPYDAGLVGRHRRAWYNTSLGAGPEEEADLAVATILHAAVREVSEEAGVVLDADQLVPWANWITPVGHPKRFDTFFYVAAVREDQQLRHQTTEASNSEWTTPGALLDAYAQGHIKVMRPTHAHLFNLHRLGSVEAAVRNPEEIFPVRPPMPAEES